MICPICGNECHVPPPRRLPGAYKEIMRAQGYTNLYFATCPRGRLIDYDALGYDIGKLETVTEYIVAIEDAIARFVLPKPGIIETTLMKLRNIIS